MTNGVIQTYALRYSPHHEQTTLWCGYTGVVGQGNIVQFVHNTSGFDHAKTLFKQCGNQIVLPLI